MAPPRSLAVLVALCGLLVAEQSPEILPGPYTIFKTEPSFVPNKVNVSYITEDRDLLEPGYTFIAPHVGTDGFGPQILDQDGDLVWYGNPTITSVKGRKVYGMNFYVCDYMGHIMDHLCYSEARPHGAEDQGIKAGGANRILNNAYEPVGEDFIEIGDLSTPNPHEFNILPGGTTFVQAVYEKRQRDLRPYKGLAKGFVIDGCIQEVDIATRSLIFQWCFLDHYELWETYLYLDIKANKHNLSSSTSGKGRKGNAWDFMHLNAVDKNSEGDYLVSGRHLSQVLKIAGPHSASGRPAGTTLWRLNGKHSDFDMQEEARFARQHHSRFISTSQNETVISLFNNAFNNSNTIPDRSSGMILRLNNSTMKATLDRIYPYPEPDHLAYAQGSMSVLPGPRNTVHVGWGSYPEWSEFSQSGSLLYHAQVYANESEKKLTNYRAFKFPWVGKPHYSPKLVAYSNSCQGPLIAYVSWNGATEVGSWRFYISETSAGPRTLAGTFDKKTFETKVQLSTSEYPHSFAPWVTVHAIDKTDGSVLGMTSSRTFVPKSKIQPDCNKDGCFPGTRFIYNETYSQSCSHPSLGSVMNLQTHLSAIICLILAILAIESWNAMVMSLLQFLIDRRRPTRRRPVQKRLQGFRIP